MPFDGTQPNSIALLALDRLRFAREQIAAGHWCQRDFEDNDGNRCATGWLGWHEPAVHLPIYKAAVHPLWLALPKSARGRYPKLPDMSDDIAYYNDRHTRQTVLKLFDRAIEEATRCQAF